MVSLKVSQEGEGKAVLRYSRSFCREQRLSLCYLGAEMINTEIQRSSSGRPTTAEVKMPLSRIKSLS